MKNIYKKALYILFAAITITGCEDEDKSPLFVDSDPSNNAAFVVITKQTSVIDFTDPSTSYDFTISAPKNNVASINISVKAAGSSLDPVPIASSSSIPANFKITANDIATALGVSVTDFNAGDRFDFSSTVKGTDGTIATFKDLSAPSQGPGQFQGFNHVTYMSCPFVASEAIGTYTVTSDGFGAFEPVTGPFEVTAGPTDDTVIVTGLYTAERSFTMSVNLKDGIATIPRQIVADTFDGYPLGTINTNAITSFFFSCTGEMILNLFYADSDGGWGNYKLVAKKN